ncbi:MAG: asparagine--tRNA ligase [Bacilli bacterium]|nr:asparagine--tRNA ligase [Bacilli bacterium]
MGICNMDIKDLYQKDYLNQDVTISGWVKNHRKQASLGFIDLFDGTCLKSIQVVYNDDLKEFNEVQKYLVGSALEVAGKLTASEGNQEFEIKASSIKLLGACSDEYPIQPKRHTKEYLRTVAHLRPRTNLYNAIFRVRSVSAFAIHEYFQKNGFIYFHSPIITASDAEGAGDMFKVTAFDLDNLKKSVDYSEDFFGKKAGLTVSGQLEAETFAFAYKKVYTFGPTFRAENSNTKTHASEFWMIEPEIAFCNLSGNMDIIEDMLKYIIKYVLDKCPDEMALFNNFVEKGIIDKLNNLISSHFKRITHQEVVDILLKSDTKWEFMPRHDEDLAKEHEKYITDYFNGPVFITDWPKDIKAFYMKQNDDNKTVAAVDLIVPGAGELVGGSQREEDYDKLVARMKELGIDDKSLEWYLDLRKYGSVIHSGFGMGFERLLIYLTGVDNIRDVIPFPRTPGHCEF